MKNETYENTSLVKETFELNAPLKMDKLKQFEELKTLLEKWDAGDFVADTFNLQWKQKAIIEDKDGGGTFQAPNRLTADYSRGIWATASITHEMTHLILAQHNWADIPEIKAYIERHEDLHDPSQVRSSGYPIEQMIAYLVMKDAMLEIAKTEKRVDENQVQARYNDEWFKKTLETEYPTEHLKTLGRRIIDGWRERPEKMPVTDWIVTLLED